MTAPDASPTTTLPSLIEHERRILGAALLDPDARTLILTTAAKDDFYSQTNRIVYEALDNAQVDEAGSIDTPLLAHQLEREGLIPEVGDRLMFLLGLIEVAAPTALCSAYLSDLRGCRNARALHALGEHLSATALASHGDAQTVSGALNSAEQQLSDLSTEVSEAKSMSFEEALGSDLSEQPVTSPTGFERLDKLLAGGFREQQVIVAAGRPAMGKSTISMDFIRHAAIRQAVPSLIVSLEMSVAELIKRSQAAEAQVPLDKLLTGTADAYDLRAIEETTQRVLAPAPLYMATPPATLSAVFSVIREVVRRHGVKIVCVDYLQLLLDPDAKEGRQNYIAAASIMFKALARELHITIIMVAQLNRGPETRGGDHRPMVSDLRESGQIEQDADVILLLHRPEVYDAAERPGEADLIVAKHRNGPTGVVPLAFLGHYTKFANMAGAEYSA